MGHARLTGHGRWMAAVLACGDGAFLSHRSAAALWGLAPVAGSRVEVTTEHSRRRRPGIHLHVARRLHPDDRSKRLGIPVTGIARTLADLAGVVGQRRLARAFEEADRLRLLDVRAISQLCDRSRGRRGVAALRALVSDHSRPLPDTRSELERLLADLCREVGLPLPAFNVIVAGFEVDAIWPHQRLVVELDGYAYHHTRAVFERDRARDAALQVAGYRVLRVTYRRLVDDPVGVAEAIRSLLSATASSQDRFEPSACR